MKFEEIPFSEMEAALVVEGMSAWPNFDVMEEAITLDELLLMHEALMKSKQNHFKMLATLQGVNPEEFDDDDSRQNLGDDDLPEELLAAERAWQEKKRQHIQSGDNHKAELESMGIGYSKQ